MADLESMFAFLRAAAAEQGSQWMQAQMQGLLGVAGVGTAPPAPEISRPRRVRPPECLSPESTPRVQRRVRSPSGDPPGLAASRSSASRPGRNPVARRDPQSRSACLPAPRREAATGSGPVPGEEEGHAAALQDESILVVGETVRGLPRPSRPQSLGGQQEAGPAPIDIAGPSYVAPSVCREAQVL